LNQYRNNVIESKFSRTWLDKVRLHALTSAELRSSRADIVGDEDVDVNGWRMLY
jgi:hypothetical protein